MDLYEMDINSFKPKLIFFFAGQGSPKKSFYKKKETYLSNFRGCKNFLEVILNSSIVEFFLGVIINGKGFTLIT